MPTLHILQGGVENGDKAWLERAARLHKRATHWIVPKSVAVGDHVVIFIRNYGFFATAKVDSAATPRKGWLNRYGARLRSIKLIDPPISLGAILQKLPMLKWARYPRSITTPSLASAVPIRALIAERRKTRMPDLDAKSLDAANMQELRRVALLSARSAVSGVTSTVINRARSKAIARYVLLRAKGFCEGCGTGAPFQKTNGEPYLEPHHTTRLADDGPDHPARVIALCPNCHRRAHYSDEAKIFNSRLKKKVLMLEAKRGT